MYMELNQKIEHQLKQTLQLALAPKMIQMLKLLSLPYIELVDKLKSEAENNVMLEVERHDELFECIRYINSDQKIKKQADFSELPGLENIKDESKTLEEFLLEQLGLEKLGKINKKIGEELISRINTRGFLDDYPSVRQEIMDKLKVSRPTVDKVLKIIQAFEPDGVGARNLKECLLIQIKEYNFESIELQEVLTKAVKNHLDDIGNKNLEKVSKGLGIPVQGVDRISVFIKENLNPAPGAKFAATSRHIIPSFSIDETDKGYKITNLESNYGPLLKINPQYLKMLDDPKTDEETKKFLKDKFESARELIENLKKRHKTSEKIMQIIERSQKEFFKSGADFLAPLLQKDLAVEFGVHPSTISRAISEKYVQTPKGLFPIKFLCPRNHKGFTPARLKLMISAIVSEEDSSSPLSDEGIKEKLKTKGADVARRTINEYRKELKIPAGKDRLK